VSPFREDDRVYHRVLCRYGCYVGKHNWGSVETSSYVRFDGDDPDEPLPVTTDLLTPEAEAKQA
jgi:hypothetical protein